MTILRQIDRLYGAKTKNIGGDKNKYGKYLFKFEIHIVTSVIYYSSLKAETSGNTNRPTN